MMKCIEVFVLIVAIGGIWCLPEQKDQHSEDQVHHVNNRQPIFKNCSFFQFSVKEEQRRGTSVVTVKAEDPDPPENGGKITYSLKGSPKVLSKFQINQNTGEIITTKMLDSEEKLNQFFDDFTPVEYYFRVVATDNGNPQLYDSCPVKISVEDINDNNPLPSRPDFRASLPVDFAVNSDVLKILATDDDVGDNGEIHYRILRNDQSKDADYFSIGDAGGIITLKKKIDQPVGYEYKFTVVMEDRGDPPRNDTVPVIITVIGSFIRKPTIINPPSEPIVVPENIPIKQRIFNITAVSNIPENVEKHETLNFILDSGQSETTNSKDTFRIANDPNNTGTAYIMAVSNLDYERIKQYYLTVRVKNIYDLFEETMITINIEDVNDKMPKFDTVEDQSIVLENEPRGTRVTQVHAVDGDGPKFNKVTYSLGNYQDIFSIDSKTGNIITLKELDRESVEFYVLKVIATDNAPSALEDTNKPNQVEERFTIRVADKNDNPPRFNQTEYRFKSVKENTRPKIEIGNVYAIDKDSVSEITYRIIHGDDDHHFKMIDNSIYIRTPLDYEKQTEYNLTILAFDKIFNDTTTVIIPVLNVNDIPPVFDFNNTIEIEEERIYDDKCLLNVKAYDPDIGNRSVDQRIIYQLSTKNSHYAALNTSGCLKIIQPLNRDLPNGSPQYDILISALDDNGSNDSFHSTAIIHVKLTDINDNAPFLNMPPPVWNENQSPGRIVKLTAFDYDTQVNGPPFLFEMANNSANDYIKDKFYISNGDLFANTTFDREERKSYDILVSITDSGTPTMTGTSTLTVIIGDVNDNAMESGNSSIFVYNYEENNAITDIGKVYVNDLDDWDLPDKTFTLLNNPNENFDVDKDTGMIKMRPNKLEGTVLLEFRVEEKRPAPEPLNVVNAYVNVTIKSIPKEAVDKSGSIRFIGITAEEFIAVDSKGQSKRDELQKYLAKLFNTSVNNVDVFTVLHSSVEKKDKAILDVRFSAHGSPYYLPEKLNTLATIHYQEIERTLNATVMMISIDECLVETKSPPCNNSCQNYLNITNLHGIFTNETSFVGVKAIVEPLCSCPAEKTLNCLNGGTPINNTCHCPPGFEGPMCEFLDISFTGRGYAIMPAPKIVCGRSHLSIEILTFSDNGLVFYFGPINYMKLSSIRDFMSLEVVNGFAVLHVDYGFETVKLINSNVKINDENRHKIDIHWDNSSIGMNIDPERNLTYTNTIHYWNYTDVDERHEILNINGPLQMGGTISDFNQLSKELHWNYTPSHTHFSGCLRNLTINNETYSFNTLLVNSKTYSSCTQKEALVAAFRFGPSFYITIILCFIIAILIAFAVYFRRQRDSYYLDELDEVKESIIHYEEEGGGESDNDINLKVLNPVHLSTPVNNDSSKSDLVLSKLNNNNSDKDSEVSNDYMIPYAYEGDGDSDGSLSSLVSDSEDDDLNLYDLSKFGQKFSKLSDMYGHNDSDNDEL